MGFFDGLTKAKEPSGKAVQGTAQTDPREASETLDTMYPASVAVQREVQIDPDTSNTGPAQTTRPAADFFTSGNGVRYNQLGLRAGGFEPSTHRGLPNPEAQATARDRQERKKWLSLERVLGLFDHH